MNAQVQEEPGQIQLFERLQQGGISIAALSRETGVPRPTIYYWNTRLPPEPVRKLVTRLLNRHGVDPIGIWSREKVHMGSVIRLVPSPKTTRKTKKMDVTAAESLTEADLAHFGLAQDPFEYIANPEDTWFPDALQRMQEKILRSLKSKGIVVVAGDPGGGKTTLLRKMYASLLQNRRVKLISPASLDRSKITSAALSVAIIRDLVGTDTSGWAAEARSELLRRTLEEQNNAGISPVLTLDEAHKLTDNALVAIKQVWDSHVLLRQLSVLLIGQVPLKERLLQAPILREVTGRAMILDMPKLGQYFKGNAGTGARSYLSWRFARVGANADAIFAPDSYKVLEVRAGTPLFLNNLAVRACIQAAEQGQKVVTSGHVARV